MLWDWDFPLAMFITTSVISFLGAILDKDIKRIFDMKIIVLGSIAMGAIGGIIAVVMELIIELIKLLWH